MVLALRAARARRRRRSSCSTGRTRSAASRVEGGTVSAGCESFVGLGAVPVRHGLTIGEMARLVVAGMPWGARVSRGRSTAI